MSRRGAGALREARRMPSDVGDGGGQEAGGGPTFVGLPGDRPPARSAAVLPFRHPRGWGTSPIGRM